MRLHANNFRHKTPSILIFLTLQINIIIIQINAEASFKLHVVASEGEGSGESFSKHASNPKSLLTPRLSYI